MSDTAWVMTKNLVQPRGHVFISLLLTVQNSLRGITRLMRRTRIVRMPPLGRRSELRLKSSSMQTVNNLATSGDV